MVATEDIAQGELIGVIPRAMMMAYNDPKTKSNYVKKLFESKMFETANYAFNIKLDRLLIDLYIM